MQFSEHLKGDGQQIFEHVCKLGLEGIVSKRIDFPYLSGRSKSWLKTRVPSKSGICFAPRGLRKG
jgi:bifunctional non-homologous end joining protein LigD